MTKTISVVMIKMTTTMMMLMTMVMMKSMSGKIASRKGGVNKPIRGRAWNYLMSRSEIKQLGLADGAWWAVGSG